MIGALDFFYPVHGADVILSIHSEHAEKIYSGVKKYELRKVSPKTVPRRVFLYDTSKKAITGYFCTELIIKGAVHDVWGEVGESAAPKARFFAYYNKSNKAVAFKISCSVKFSRPLPFADLIKVGVSAAVPQVFTYIEEGVARNHLDQVSFHELVAKQSKDFAFSPLRPDRYDDFVNQVDMHISGSYQETGRKYGEYLIDQHVTGFDAEGVFTFKKICFEITKRGEHFGYIVLTLKRGGSVKTGPTIIAKEFRDQGFGRVLREKLHDFLRLMGYRKVYVTVPAINKAALYYLLDSGYTIESHLSRHYHTGHDELVLGFSLEPNANECPKINRSKLTAYSFSKMRSKSVDAALFLSRRFPEVYFPVPDEWISLQISLAAKCSRGKVSGFKNRLMFCAENDGDIKVVALCVLKRGGSAKIVLLSDIDHEESLVKFLDYISSSLVKQNLGLRKIYSHIAVSDSALYSSFLGAGYVLEGVIKRPYNCYRDMLVMAKSID